MVTIYRAVKDIVTQKLACEEIGGEYIHIAEDEYICKVDKFIYGKVAGRFVFSIKDVEVEAPWRPVSTYKNNRVVLIRSGKVKVAIVDSTDVFVEEDGKLQVRYKLTNRLEHAYQVPQYGNSFSKQNPPTYQ